MARTVGIGIQDFETIMSNEVFYVDKTHFIKEWWDSDDSVTLIARPRRFGKTLNMSMLDRFFSNRYENQEELFRGLYIWGEEKYRKLAGSYPVISLSFAGVKETTYEKSVSQISDILKELFRQYSYLTTSEKLTIPEKELMQELLELQEPKIKKSIHDLSELLYKHFGKKVLIFLDEYDTPMQEAYVSGYWDEFTSFIRSMFNSTFKTNPYMERAVMTGITTLRLTTKLWKFAEQTSRSSAKAEVLESIFSDLNNLEVITTTSSRYASAFGFTEKEVFAAMDEQGIPETEKEKVKNWYDGFTFGELTDIYNPWSIINYLDKKKLAPYWANTSSNSLVGKLIRESGAGIKKTFEALMRRETIRVPVDEQIVYNQLDNNESAIWSLLLATGYLKLIDYETGEEYQYSSDGAAMYELRLTNEETHIMFRKMIHDWFGKVQEKYNDFIKALLLDDVRSMNRFINTVSQTIFSYFDSGERPSGAEPERFYHGFVLGLMVEMSGDYVIRSNRESGFGRYDVMIYTRKSREKGIIIEFKVHDSYDEKDLEETVASALKQIEEKKYETELTDLGFPRKNIRKYGFAFEGKNVLIG